MARAPAIMVGDAGGSDAIEPGFEGRAGGPVVWQALDHAQEHFGCEILNHGVVGHTVSDVTRDGIHLSLIHI